LPLAMANCSSLTRASCHALQLIKLAGRNRTAARWDLRSPDPGAPPHVTLFSSSVNKILWKKAATLLHMFFSEELGTFKNRQVRNWTGFIGLTENQ
jgi:hypothetical protein